MVRPSLVTYRKKRDFSRTPEPAGAKAAAGKGGRFVVHEHHASRLHFDLRLEMGGVLKSYAVPKGPSMDPSVRRLAVETEDHPVEYLSFQGTIGEGQYGAGQMVIWDMGTYACADGEDPLRAYAAGKLHLEFRGEKLRGGFMLIRGRGDRQWLLFKQRDDEAKDAGSDGNPALILPYGSRSERPPGFEIPKQALRRTALRGTASHKTDSRRTLPRKTALRKTEMPPGANAPKRRRGALDSTPPVPRTEVRPAGARDAALPDFVPPMLATLADKPFDDPAWIFENKWDGWRAQMRIDKRGMRLISRSGKSLDAMFPELLTRRAEVKAESCLIDGEIVALDSQGIPRFQLLQNRLKGKAHPDGDVPIIFYAFDLPHCEGRDLTACALSDRKVVLRAILHGSGGGAEKRAGSDGVTGMLRYSEHFAAEGKRTFREAVELGLEGVVAKRADSRYRGGRSADWLKVKSKARQEFVIAGYTRPRGARILFGSLVAGLYRDGELSFAGHVGGGFDTAMLKDVSGFLEPLKTPACPFQKAPKTNEAVQWVRPVLVAEAEFAEWTGDGLMRQPIFLGLRADKDPKECVREKPEPASALRRAAARKRTESGTAGEERDRGAPPGGTAGPALREHPHGVTRKLPVSEAPALTHPDKVYWPADGYTKADLAAYYQAVAPFILPHLKDRPLILKRFPDGIDRPPFFQHDVKHAPPFVATAPIQEEAGIVNYALCRNRETLMWLANLGVIPQNPWLSRVPHVERPDFIAFDLDPQDVAFSDVCQAALQLKEVLDEFALAAWVKTSGSRGIHVFVPLKPRYDFDQSLGFAQLVAAYTVNKRPDSFTVERALKARPRDRIYLDCMQNSRGKSVASVYSVRERPGAPVSAPLAWPELKKKFSMKDFNLRNLPKRLERKGDLFAPVLKGGQALESALRKLERKVGNGRSAKVR